MTPVSLEGNYDYFESENSMESIYDKFQSEVSETCTETLQNDTGDVHITLAITV